VDVEQVSLTFPQLREIDGQMTIMSSRLGFWSVRQWCWKSLRSPTTTKVIKVTNMTGRLLGAWKIRSSEYTRLGQAGKELHFRCSVTRSGHSYGVKLAGVFGVNLDWNHYSTECDRTCFIVVLAKGASAGGSMTLRVEMI